MAQLPSFALFLDCRQAPRSIHKASAELRVSAPAISTQLKLLEEQLGEKLLARSGRRLVIS